MPGYTREQTARRLKRGFGGGDGDDYRPWLGVRDVPSMGIRTRQVGRTSRRMHVTMSLLERASILVAQRLPYLVQIKEQFPLPLDGTDAIAARLGVRPPRHKGKPVTVTTDLVLHFDGPCGPWREAVAVKPFRKLKHRRVNELLNIERAWWAGNGVRWRRVTERELPPALIANLAWMDEHHDLLPGVLRGASADDVAEALLDALRAGDRTLMDAAGDADRATAQSAGTALLVFRHMLARGRWSVPLGDEIRTDRVLDPGTLTVAPGPPPAGS